MTEIDGQRAYSNKASRYQRLLLLNTSDLARPYVVDVFRVTGGTTHDYVFHGAIRWDQNWECSFPLVTNSNPYPMLEGSETWTEPASDGDTFPYYGFWRNVSSNQAPGNFQITYRDTNRVAGRDTAAVDDRRRHREQFISAPRPCRRATTRCRRISGSTGLCDPRRSSAIASRAARCRICS